MLESLESAEYQSVLVSLRRVTRVMKGGKRFRFSALVVVGDGQGNVGVALAKAPEALLAIRKAENKAKKNIFKVPIVNDTIPHEVIGENTTSVVLLKPAGKGTGIIASMPVRSILEKAGYKNVLTKSLGSNNHINLVWATIDALKKLKTREEYFKILHTTYTEDEYEKYLHKKPEKPLEKVQEKEKLQEKSQEKSQEKPFAYREFPREARKEEQRQERKPEKKSFQKPTKPFRKVGDKNDKGKQS